MLKLIIKHKVIKEGIALPKNCINCGCPISGEGKNKIFCDACLRKISPFLKFISTSKVPAVKLYDANEEKLRSMGLSDMALAYLSKCCHSYDEKKAAAAAVPVVASETPTPKAEKSEDTAPVAAVPPVTEVSEAAHADETEKVAADGGEPSDADANTDDEDIVIPAVIPPVGVDQSGNGGDDGAGDDGDEYEDDESGDGAKRLTLIIIAAVLTLIIFLVLYIGRYIPGYTPGGKDTDDANGTESVTDNVGSDSDSETTNVSGTDDTDDDTTDTDDTSYTDTDDTTDTEEDTTDTESGETTDAVCVHEWVDASCTSPSSCLLCGETEGDALGHDYKDATCTDPETCSRCGDTKGDALGHDVDDATCTEASVCARCVKTVKAALGHSYKDATCTSASVCSRCGETKGDALGHDYKAATCTDPEICSRCGDTKGDALGHTSGGAKCLRCGKYYVTLTARGIPVTDSNGLSVNVSSIVGGEFGNDHAYTVFFTATNSTEDSVNLGGFKLFYVDENGNYGGAMKELWQPINPGGETFTGSVTLTVPAGMTPVVLEYYPDEYALSGMSSPHGDGEGAFFWKV